MPGAGLLYVDMIARQSQLIHLYVYITVMMLDVDFDVFSTSLAVQWFQYYVISDDNGLEILNVNLQQAHDPQKTNIKCSPSVIRD